MRILEKSFYLSKELIKNPLSSFDRINSIVKSFYFNAERSKNFDLTLEISEFLEIISDKYNCTEFLRDLNSEFDIIQDYVSKYKSQNVSLIKSYFNADLTLSKSAYILTRLFKPTILFETGTANGITSEFILRALNYNDLGHLVSIDLPSIVCLKRDTTGCVISKESRKRWTFHKGSSLRILPKLLKKVKYIDLFLHDSNNSYYTQSLELKIIASKLKSGSIIVVNNIGKSPAFQEFVDKIKPKESFIIKQIDKPKSYTGIVII